MADIAPSLYTPILALVSSRVWDDQPGGEMLKSRALFPALFAVFSIAGAVQQRSQPATSMSRDSAGVSIVRNIAPEWTAQTAWRLSPVPILEIGAQAGSVDYLLSGVRTPLKLLNGEIALVDGGSTEIRFYDARGRFLRRSGRRGQGPGEFSDPPSIRRLSGDTLLVSNPWTVFSPDGRYLRRLRFPLAPGQPSQSVVTPIGGRFVLMKGGAPRGWRDTVLRAQTSDGGITTVKSAIRPAESATAIDLLTHYLFGIDGSFIDSVDAFAFDSKASLMPFPPVATYTAYGEDFFFSAASSFDIRRYSVMSSAGSRPRARRRR
jgi:hypothetical protein